MASESQLIAALTDVFQNGASGWPSKEILLGIGDDGAVLLPRERKSVAVADMAVEDVHFRRAWSSLADIGAKVTAANLADVFAMGGVPTFLLVTAGLPAGFTEIQMRELAMGIQGEANKVGVVVIGGDLTRSEKLVISVTAFGDVDIPVLRSGAKAGDSVVLLGFPGWAAAGLSLFEGGLTEFAVRNAVVARAMAAHRQPEVNYSGVGHLLGEGVHAMCDISDGLLSEAGHLATSSKVAIEIDADSLIALPDFALLAELGELAEKDPWEWILSGGEDHCFLATVGQKHLIPTGTIKIGKVLEGSGVSLAGDLSGEGALRYLQSGYHHFGN